MRTLLILLRGDGLQLSDYAAVKGHLDARCGGCSVLFTEPKGTVMGLLVNTALPVRMLLREIEPAFLYKGSGFITILPLAHGWIGTGNNVGLGQLRRHLKAAESSE